MLFLFYINVHTSVPSIQSESNLLGEVYIIHELIKRNEMTYLDLNQSELLTSCIEATPSNHTHTTLCLVTVTERLESVYVAAGGKKHWKTVRLAAAILGKVVDTLAPAITSVLVRGKEVLLLILQKT